MGLSGFLNLEGSDIAGFFGASVLGYLAGLMAASGPWAIVIQIVVAYHLFLLWLIYHGHQAPELSMSRAATATTHLACLTVALLPLLDGHHGSAIFQIFRFSIAGLAVFERGWLFTPIDGPQPNRAPIAPPSSVIVASDGTDFEEWQRHLESLQGGGYRPGVSVRDEYERWLLLRRQRSQAMSR